jgi:hypothetical protein
MCLGAFGHSSFRGFLWAGQYRRKKLRPGKGDIVSFRVPREARGARGGAAPSWARKRARPAFSPGGRGPPTLHPVRPVRPPAAGCRPEAAVAPRIASFRRLRRLLLPSLHGRAPSPRVPARPGRSPCAARAAYREVIACGVPTGATTLTFLGHRAGWWGG